MDQQAIAAVATPSAPCACAECFFSPYAAADLPTQRSDVSCTVKAVCGYDYDWLEPNLTSA